MNKKPIGKQAIFLDANDIRDMLAEKFNVPKENVIKSQYSYTIKFENEEGEKDENN